MRETLLLITMFLGLVTGCFAQSDYYIKKAQSYQREAEGGYVSSLGGDALKKQ